MFLHITFSLSKQIDLPDDMDWDRDYDRFCEWAVYDALNNSTTEEWLENAEVEVW